MKVNSLLLTILAGALLFACQSPTSEQVQKDIITNTDDQRRLRILIDSMEKVVYNENFDLDEGSSSSLMEAYTEYTTKYVGDQRTPEYLYKSAAISRAVGLPIKAIRLYDRILADYPNFERNPEVAFLLAFTYDEDLKQPERAKEAYQDLLDKYPDDMWAEQATARLENIDKSDDELIKSFMEQNKTD